MSGTLMNNYAVNHIVDGTRQILTKILGDARAGGKPGPSNRPLLGRTRAAAGTYGSARVPRAASCPFLVARRFQAVKVRSCRPYAAMRWYEDLTLPKTQSLPVAIP
jgi:hypothetical protein